MSGVLRTDEQVSGADLQSGDLVWVDFDPAFGHAQRGRRPALVLTNGAYNRRSSFTIVCPVTSSRRRWPFHVDLPAGKFITGTVIVDQIKAVDSRRIVTPAVDRVDDEIMSEVHRTLSAILSAGFDTPTL